MSIHQMKEKSTSISRQKTQNRATLGFRSRDVYRTRDAAAEWDKFYSDAFKSIGFEGGSVLPFLLHHPKNASAVWVHSDEMLL